MFSKYKTIFILNNVLIIRCLFIELKTLHNNFLQHLFSNLILQNCKLQFHMIRVAGEYETSNNIDLRNLALSILNIILLLIQPAISNLIQKHFPLCIQSFQFYIQSNFHFYFLKIKSFVSFLREGFISVEITLAFIKYGFYL